MKTTLVITHINEKEWDYIIYNEGLNTSDRYLSKRDIDMILDIYDKTSHTLHISDRECELREMFDRVYICDLVEDTLERLK